MLKYFFIMAGWIVAILGTDWISLNYLNADPVTVAMLIMLSNFTVAILSLVFSLYLELKKERDLFIKDPRSPFSLGMIALMLAFTVVPYPDTGLMLITGLCLTTLASIVLTRRESPPSLTMIIGTGCLMYSVPAATIISNNVLSGLSSLQFSVFIGLALIVAGAAYVLAEQEVLFEDKKPSIKPIGDTTF